MSKKDRNKERRGGIGRAVAITFKVLKNRLSHNIVEAGIDLTVEQVVVLCHLWEREGMNQQQLSEMFAFNKASATRMIDGLEKKKLAIRIPDEQDRRQKMIYLTPKGKEIVPILDDIIIATHHEALSGISAKDIEKLWSILKSIRLNLGEGID